MLGLAKAIASLKDIILSIWRIALFYREKQVEARIEVIANSLPVLEKIADLEASNKLAAEHAQALRLQVIAGVSAVMTAGVIIPDVSAFPSFSPRALLAPPQRALTEGHPDEGSVPPRKRQRKRRPSASPS